MDNYYQDIWTKKDGAEFWKNVNFNSSGYKLQEQVFRKFLKGLKALKNSSFGKEEPIESVLELGIGTGRMSKIMLEVFPDIEIYNAIDINFFPIKFNNIDVYVADVTNEIFFENINSYYSGRRWDLVLASEVFMHIKPEDIETVLKRVTKLLAPNGVIINIDWFVSAPEPSNWCFIHDYDKLYRENQLQTIFTADIPEIKQKLFCYGA